MGVSQKAHSSSELHAADLFADVPTSKFESEDEEATRMYIAPSAVQLSSSLLNSMQPSRVAAAPESVVSIGGWDASTTASAISPRVSAQPPFRAPAASSKSKTLFAGLMSVAVLLTGGGAIYAATRVSGTPVAQRTVVPAPVVAVAAAPVMAPIAAPVRAVEPVAPAVEQPEIASVETLYAAMQADKAAKAAASAAAPASGGTKHVAVAHASKPVKAVAPSKAPAVHAVPTPVAKAPTPVAKAPKAVRPVKASELDDAL